MTDWELLADRIDTSLRETSRAVVAALVAQGVNAEKRHDALVRELRIINRSIASSNDRADGMDSKLAELVDYAKQQSDWQVSVSPAK